MSNLKEHLILNPVEFTPTLPEIDITGFIGEAGPDYGESSVLVERIKKELGEGVTSRSWPSIECSVPLVLSPNPAVTQADAFSPIELFVSEVQQKNAGWIRRDFADAAGFSGSVACPVDAAGIPTPKGLGYVDEVTMKLMRHPFWFATVEILAGEAKGSNVRDLQLELADLLGTAPGLIRVVVKNEGTEDWRGCYVSLPCDDYSSAATAKEKYEAKELTLKGGSTIEGGIVKCPPLTAGWVTVLSSQIAGVGHMTHAGPRRMLFRLSDAGVALGDIQFKLEWRTLGSAEWIQTMEGSTPIIRSSPVAGFQLLDLGECRPARAITGSDRWEWRLQACSLSSSGRQPQIRDVYPMSTEQWLRVSDSSENPIDGNPGANAATAENATGVGTVAWKTKSGTGTMSFAEESKYPTFSGTEESNYLKVTNFGFGSFVPTGATIRGIGAVAEPLSASGTLEEKRIRLVIEGSVKAAEDKAGKSGGPQYWRTPEIRGWGGLFDLWGQALITRAQVVASNFGLAIALGSNSIPEVGETRAITFKRIELGVAYSEGGNENRICFASRSVEFSDSGVRRQHTTDEVWGELVPEGMLLDAPVGGQEGKPANLLVIPSVGDFAARPDSATVKPGVKVFVRPAHLHAREAAA